MQKNIKIKIKGMKTLKLLHNILQIPNNNVDVKATEIYYQATFASKYFIKVVTIQQLGSTTQHKLRVLLQPQNCKS